MRRLMRQVMGRTRGTNPERGAVAALVVILMGSGVLVGLGAVVVDAGQIYAAASQVQNSADAAALKIAAACATNPPGTACASNPGNSATSAYTVANSYVTKNTNGGAAHITTVCGSGAAVIPTTCPTDKTDLYCPNTPAGNYVEVHVKTGAGTTDTLLPPAFGSALLGDSYKGKVVGACAQAKWGAIRAATGVSLTVSLCAWMAATNNGATFAPGPDFTTYPSTGYATWPNASVVRYPYNNAATPPLPGAAGGEQVLQLHGSGNDCAGNAGSGWQLPGGFGWLDDPGNNCKTYIDINNTYHDNTGVAQDGACTAPPITSAFEDSLYKHTILYLPIYDGTQGTGSNGTYHLAGFASFVITGGWFTGSGGWKVASSISGKNYCGGSLRCLYGFFTRGLLPAGAVPGSGTNYGASVVGLSG